jgi:predicted helicase
VVWQVLQALRSHDDRFHAMVNQIELNKKKPPKIHIIPVTNPSDVDVDQPSPSVEVDQPSLPFPTDAFVDAMYARIVQKVGERTYWEDWAKDVAEIANAHIVRIKGLLTDPQSSQSKEFAEFLRGLRGNLNENVTEDDAIVMLAQHLITRPIFEALFDGYQFADTNPVARTMELMLASLDEAALPSENERLEGFYASVQRRVEGVDNAEGKQRIIVELYDKFFSTAFPQTVKKLGVVYTPIEIVDFILRSADAVLREEFGQGLTDEGVHILDGFTGTGTFLVRLLQSGLIEPHDLARKYANEIHGNEILLLAYYIACVNIETTYQDLTGKVEDFPGLVLTDTFQSWEPDDRPDLDVFPENNARLEHLKSLPITVIVGNPPYSVGQESANDNAANEKYPSLDAEIRNTYAAQSDAGLVRNLYDSYVRAIKWATLRLNGSGVVAFVTNGGFLDSNNADGMRRSLADEFSSIHVLNLRGNQRTAGETARKEGGKVFGGGSRATVAVTILVKNPASSGPANIHYVEVDDYLTREEKLAHVQRASSVVDLPSVTITPDEYGDWLNQRRDDFAEHMPVRGDGAVFASSTLGASTARDVWVYNFRRDALAAAVSRLIETYEKSDPSAPEKDPKQISWSAGLLSRLQRKQEIRFRADAIRTGMYRPFTKQHLYFAAELVERPGQVASIFPTEQTPNLAICVTGVGAGGPFTALMTDSAPNLNLPGAGNSTHALARWRYESADTDGTLDFSTGDEDAVAGYRRIDNISDAAFKRFQGVYPDDAVTREDIFFYVYGVLHSVTYRTDYGADLKKMLPRIPFVQDFRGFVEAGRRLADLHVGYESVEPYKLDGLDIEATEDPFEFFAVEKKMKLSKDRKSIVYNERITVSGIPDDALRYMVGSRSAIEWIVDRYYVTADNGKNGSGIVNNPNDWSKEVGDPRYILDLLARIVTVSLETNRIVDALPPLDIIEGA